MHAAAVLAVEAVQCLTMMDLLRGTKDDLIDGLEEPPAQALLEAAGRDQPVHLNGGRRSLANGDTRP